jgi:hypothetical protein
MLLLASGRLSLAERFAQKCLEKKSSPHETDFLYLQLRSLLPNKESHARRLCAVALKRFPEDSRFLLIAGYLAWREYEEDPGNKIGKLDEAIARTQEGLEGMPRDSIGWLKCDLLNNKAYFLSLKGGSSDMSMALEALSSIEAFRNKESWRGSWLDTLGFVRLCRARDTGLPPEERYREIGGAIGSFESALEKFLSPLARSITRRHLAEARELQRKLPSHTISSDSC